MPVSFCRRGAWTVAFVLGALAIGRAEAGGPVSRGERRVGGEARVVPVSGYRYSGVSARPYRYPFNYPYYRYAPRHYPFGNGPYGPYDSNYGGYSGNAFDPSVYGSLRWFPRLGIGGAGGALDADAPPPPPPDNGDNNDDRREAPQSTLETPYGSLILPPGVRAVGPGRAIPRNPAPDPLSLPPAYDDGDEIGIPVPIPTSGPPVEALPPGAPIVGNRRYGLSAYGDPLAEFGGQNPYAMSAGAGAGFANDPYTRAVWSMWWSGPRMVYGFGYYPNHTWAYNQGPPNGYGYFGNGLGNAEMLIHQLNLSIRRYGPYGNNFIGQFNTGGFYQGW